jgi:hypothetical protein
MAMSRPKGLPKTGGRKPGSGNRLQRDVRETIIAAFYEAGGVAYLKEQAVENPTAFLALLGKTLPRDVRAEVTVTLAALIEESLKPGDDAKVIEHRDTQSLGQAVAEAAAMVEGE